MKYNMLRAWLCLGIVVGHGACKAGLNELQGVYHHQGAVDGDKTSIELGKVAFYFAQEPLAKKIEKTQHHTHSVELFFPDAIMTPAARSMLVAFAHKRSPWYTVKITGSTKQQQGITCHITFDDAQVVFTYETTESIKQQKAVILTFYNRQLLDRIATHNKSMLRTALSHKPGIVIDVGHGGADTGARSWQGVYEKDVTLGLGLVLAQLLKEDGYDVFLTRTGDATLALDSRTTFANCCADGDLFISLHANATANRAVHGLETYSVSLANCQSMLVSDKQQSAAIDLYRSDLSDRGRRLAASIHKNAVDVLHAADYQVTDRQVKTAVTQVLIGAQMPAALVEIGFLSHHHEARLLASADYQRLLAQGICSGIKDYLHHNEIRA